MYYFPGSVKPISSVNLDCRLVGRNIDSFPEKGSQPVDQDTCRLGTNLIPERSLHRDVPAWDVSG